MQQNNFSNQRTNINSRRIPNNRKKNNFFSKKELFIILLILFFVFLGIFLFKKKDNISFFKQTSIFSNSNDNIKITIYYSRGSRDNTKKEQTIFAINDPIQVKIDFENMNDGETAEVSIKKEGSQDVLQSTNILLGKEKGSRFINLTNNITKESGKYQIEVFKNADDKNKILSSKEFEVK